MCINQEPKRPCPKCGENGEMFTSDSVAGHIIIITYKCEETGRTRVSHGVDTKTGKTIILPPEDPRFIGYFDPAIGEWILK